MDCLFCKIVKNEIPSYTIYEDIDTRAFLDIMPSTTGHVMVVHKKHGETIHGYTPGELGKLMGTVQSVAKALEKTYKTDVLTIGVNHGEPAGVHHLHVHLMPRVASDGGKVLQSLVSQKPSQSFQEIVKDIKANL